MRDGFSIGPSVGPYRVVRKIGEGGMGAVFLGEHTLIGRRAAIKVLLPELSSRRDSIDRFFNEARATTAISDPGIVQVFDFGFTADKVAYIVMELLEGEQLSHRLLRLGSLGAPDALRITRQAAGSLGAAHAAGIVHRDLKPENLYMIRDPEAAGGERPKILDFGIAKLGLGDDLPDRVKTRTGAVLGTPVYMSPEQCDGAGRVDHRADIYSLGCVLFHLVTGRPPFDLPGIGAIISAHLREAPPVPSDVVPQLPPGLDDLVLRCLAKAPGQRFQAMVELQAACDAVLSLITGGAAAMARPSSSSRVPMAMPTPALTPQPSEAEGMRTTLSTSAGQPLAGAPRRRIGLWVVAAALIGAAGSAIAVLSSRSGPRELEPPVRAAAPVAEPPPPPPAPIQARAPEAPSAAPAAAIAVDAGAAVAAPADPPAAAPSIAAPARKSAPPRTTAKPRPSKQRPASNDDLYDDRN